MPDDNLTLNGTSQAGPKPKLTWRMGIMLVLGLLLLYTALAALIVAAIFAIAPMMTPVTAALIVALVFAVLGAIVALLGWTQVKMKPLERTRETLREDVEWARSQTRPRGK
jgi:uncharacterized membrane protein YqjE